jgi:myo-inositol-1(or 4)-monophosphatase
VIEGEYFLAKNTGSFSKDNEMKKYLSVAHKAAALAVDLLRKSFLNDAKVADASGKDIKTLADVAAQEGIVNVLQKSGIPVLAEEGNNLPTDLASQVWLVDPLDGTFNFSRGFPVAAVSIALWENGIPVLGVVHDIFSRQAYSGLTGQGAWLDDQEIHVSSVGDKSQAILATGFPSGRNYDTHSLLQFVQSVQTYKKVRMLGSASLMLAHVAAGRFDVYEEEDIFLWDVAAGLALVQAAGGDFRMWPGSGLHKYHVRASNGFLK